MASIFYTVVLIILTARCGVTRPSDCVTCDDAGLPPGRESDTGELELPIRGGLKRVTDVSGHTREVPFS